MDRFEVGPGIDEIGSMDDLLLAGHRNIYVSGEAARKILSGFYTPEKKRTLRKGGWSFEENHTNMVMRKVVGSRIRTLEGGIDHLEESGYWDKRLNEVMKLLDISKAGGGTLTVKYLF